MALLVSWPAALTFSIMSLGLALTFARIWLPVARPLGLEILFYKAISILWILYLNREDLEKKVSAILVAGRAHPGGFIFNTGHGLTPQTPLKSLKQVGGHSSWIVHG